MEEVPEFRNSGTLERSGIMFRFFPEHGSEIILETSLKDKTGIFFYGIEPGIFSRLQNGTRKLLHIPEKLRFPFHKP